MNKDLETKIDWDKLHKEYLGKWTETKNFNAGSSRIVFDWFKQRIELALSALQQPETSEEILDEIHDTFFDKRFFPKSSWKKVWRDKYIILKRQQE